MRKSLGRAMHATDLSPQEYECAVDRLGAMAFGNALGTAMLWATLSGDQLRLFSLANSLASRLVGRTGRPQECLPIAGLAIMEMIYPHCRVCNGAGNGQAENGVIVECCKCHSSGKHCYTDAERAAFVGMSWRPRLQRLLDRASAQISGAELAAIAEVRAQLEKTY